MASKLDLAFRYRRGLTNRRCLGHRPRFASADSDLAEECPTSPQDALAVEHNVSYAILVAAYDRDLFQVKKQGMIVMAPAKQESSQWEQRFVQAGLHGVSAGGS